MGTQNKTTFVTVCEETSDISATQVKKAWSFLEILNPKEAKAMVDWLPPWAMGNFSAMASVYSFFTQAIASIMLRVYKPGLTIVLSTDQNIFLSIKNFPDGMSSSDWTYYAERLPDEITKYLPSETIPISDGVLLSSFVDGVPKWSIVHAQSWPTQHKSPGYNMNLLVFETDLLDDKVNWIMNYTRAISLTVQYLMKVHNPGITMLLEAMVLYRLHISWVDQREQVAKEYTALWTRMNAEFKADFDIPDSLS